MHRIALLVGGFALPVPGAVGVSAQATLPGVDFAGPVDIGGRRLWLECRGPGSPTVILYAGLLSRSDIWSRDYRESEGRHTIVLPGVGAFTRACSHKRLSAAALLAGGYHPSRSDPVPMPRAAASVVADLHALLTIAGEPGPCVLVGPSLATYPAEVARIVLVDA